ncbi:hypothetical protein [Streptomyces sp. NBC_01353]|uniref:hypothetical protein n=1 Tax=Streptomyces sp. NBC_01353 TaxID=2903835 RepID=UPI002E374DCF|nr:hypothetical protein [Streptomyces sp. NBC_01353]
MFNRIRHAAARTRERYSRKDRHRAALTLARRTVADWPTLSLRQLRDRTDFRMGEETALVRPYVLAVEELLACTCFKPAEAH